jgi:microcin C transport system permease protein
MARDLHLHVLVGLLVIITFVGEAVREAFDPKKFTYYR